MAASMSTCVCSNHLNVSSSLEKWNITGPRCTEFFLDLALKKRLLWYEVLLIYKLHNLLRQSTRYRHYYHSHHKRRNRCISVTYQCKGTLCTSRKKWILSTRGFLDLFEHQSKCLNYFGVINCFFLTIWWFITWLTLLHFLEGKVEIKGSPDAFRNW